MIIENRFNLHWRTAGEAIAFLGKEDVLSFEGPFEILPASVGKPAITDNLTTNLLIPTCCLAGQT